MTDTLITDTERRTKSGHEQMDETKWKLCLIRKEGEDFVLNVVNLSAGKKCDQKKRKRNAVSVYII